MTATETEQDLDFGPAEAILEEIGNLPSGSLIPLLQRIQAAYGYLPRDILLDVAKRSGTPVASMYGAATFYEQFRLTPRGRHMIRLCRGTACHIRGMGAILRALERILEIHEGETTPDRRFTLETVPCLGTCFLAPVMMIDDEYYGDLKPSKLAKILKNYT